jgi:hypothetical protein
LCFFLRCIGNGICNGLITHSEESYQRFVLVYVCVCLIIVI